MSRQAAWMQRTISAVESKRVPSQSNTTRSKRRGRKVIGNGRSSGPGRSMWLAEPGGQCDAFGWQRCFQRDPLAAAGVVEGQAPGVQEHAAETQAGQAFAARELPVQLEVAV